MRVYHTCASTLRAEFGVEPNAQTQALYQQLLNLKPGSASHLEPATQPVEASGTRHVLIGRHREWQKLLVAWKRAASGGPHFVLISGEAGIGKTRLADELLTWAERQSIAAAHARSYAAEGALAYAPVSEWLRSAVLHPNWQHLDDVWLSELARLLPELLAVHPDLSLPGPLTERWQRKRLFEALARATMASLHKPGLSRRALLLVLDDLQWCDRETLEWLHYLLRYEAKARMLIVGTVRPEEVTSEHPLTTLLLDLRHLEQITEIKLGPLDRSETAALAAQVADRSLDDQVQTHIYQITEGNPLFIVETVRAGGWQAVREPDQQSPTQGIVHPPLPPKVYATIQHRLAQLSPAAHELACLAAVIGRSFAFPVLAQVCDLAEDGLMRGLDELWQRRIVREQANETYDFTHDRIREVAYAETSPIKRRHLHKRVAQAIESCFPDQIENLSGQLGLHYDKAQQWPAALGYYRQAAKVSVEINALDRVLFYSGKVLALLERLPNTPEHVAWRIDSWLDMSKALIGLQGWTAAERKDALDLAYQWATEIKDERRQLQVLTDLYGYYINCGDCYRAYRLAREGIELAKQLEDEPLLPSAYNQLGSASLHQGELLTALEYFRHGIALEDRVTVDPDHVTNPRIVNLRSMLAETLWLCGYPERAHTVAVAAIQMADEQIAPHGRIHGREFMMYTAQRAGDKVAVQRLANEITELCAEFGYPDYALSAQLFLGWLTAETDSPQSGVTQIEEVLASMAQMNMYFNLPYFLSLLAQAQRKGGQIVQALLTLERALEVTETSGDCHWRAELLCLSGDLHMDAGHAACKVESLYEAALTVARQQHAKMLELRATMSLARLWQKQGRRAEAYQILAAIYGWFTEGFAAADLQAAQRLLQELGTEPIQRNAISYS